MLSQRVIAVCRFGLAATLLLANGGGPTLRHAHAGGQVPHTHDASAMKVRKADHGHPHAHPHAAKLSDSCSHVHFWVFGIEFTSLPLPADREEDSDQWGQLVISPLGIGPVVGDLPGSECNPLAAASIDDGLAETRPVSLDWADRFASIPAVAALLCDTARHERSGVQLI
jgi:hypothetical protein